MPVIYSFTSDDFGTNWISTLDDPSYSGSQQAFAFTRATNLGPLFLIIAKDVGDIDNFRIRRSTTRGDTWEILETPNAQIDVRIIDTVYDQQSDSLYILFEDYTFYRVSSASTRPVSEWLAGFTQLTSPTNNSHPYKQMTIIDDRCAESVDWST